MSPWFQTFLVTLYVIPAGVLMLFGLNLYVLLALSLRKLRRMRREADQMSERFALDSPTDPLPAVTTQIPVFNEFNVVERCMRACAAMAYPRDRHTVQILDDSTDSTSDVIDRVAAELREAGHRVEVIRRRNRNGYKAGALDEGMRRSSDGFFAIFDADFVPPVDFLQRTMGVMLLRPEVGLVQARWGHLNEAHSLLTRTQGIGIDGHFTVEQPARAWNNLVMNFNGTAGLWRRQAVDEAGGWQHDTLTEDLDLSYRSQMVGWQPYFLMDLVVPAEIPGDINAFKSQQFRWAKGSIETAIKLVPTVLRMDLPLFTKVESVIHMTHYLVHPLMLWLAVMAFPVLKLTWYNRYPFELTPAVVCILLATLAPTLLYAVSQWHLHHRPWRRLGLLPLLSLLGVGIALSNTQAVWQAVRGKRSPFVRTPKTGDLNSMPYLSRLPRLALLEVLVGVYCLFTAHSYWMAERFWVVPFIILYGLGFTVVGILSLAHHRTARRVRPLPLVTPAA